jgi:hypothetical protein
VGGYSFESNECEDGVVSACEPRCRLEEEATEFWYLLITPCMYLYEMLSGSVNSS